MTIKTFLTTYWIYIAAFALAIWNVYLHFKANKTERKKNLQTVYIELTSIINEFQVECLKHFLNYPEVLVLKLEVSENIDQAMGILKNVTKSKKTEILEKKDILTKALLRLKEDFEQTVDVSLKEKIREDSILAIAEVKLLIKEVEEENSKNQPFLDRATEIQKIAAKKVSTFRENRPQRVVSISKGVTNLINKLNNAPAWQLTASKSIIKATKELESASLNLNEMILKSVSTNAEKVLTGTIVKSEEFKKVWELSENVIKKMRSEIL